MPSGPPTWFRMIVVCGKARARSASSGSCGWYSQASKVRFERRQTRKAGAPGGVGHLALRRVGAAARERLARDPRHRVADAAEAAVAGGDLRLQHARDAVAEPQIGVSDDAGAQPALAVWPLALIAAVPLTNSISPTGFISAGPSARYIEPHSIKTVCGDVVTAAGIGEQLVEQIAVPVAVPQMMVRIDDLERRLDDLFLPRRDQAGSG